MNVVAAFLAHLALWVPAAHHVRPQEIKCIAEAVYFEARGEPIMGRVMVANVVMNRVRSPHYPNTPCKVVHQPAQFQGVKPGRKIQDKRAWKDAVEIGALVYFGLINDYTGGATHFIEKDKAHSCYWFKDYKQARIEGNHIFVVPGDAS